MRKSLRLPALMLVFSLLLSSGALAAAPGELDPQASAFIDFKYACVSCSGDTVTITFSISATGTMTKLGSSGIQLYEDGQLVKTFGPAVYTNMYEYNSCFHTSTVSYTGNPGSTYYARVTFMATNANGTGYGLYTTEEDTL